MLRLLWLLLSLAFFPLILFCLLGWFHAGEPGTHVGWKIGYGSALLVFTAVFCYGIFRCFKPR